MNRKIKIVALFGSRAFFGQERANLETLTCLRERGCEVLCIIRDDEWPEILAFRKQLEDRGLAWVTAPYIDYPLKGWMLHILRRNPGAFIRSNLVLSRIIREFQPTHIHAFNPLYIANFYWTLRRTRLPLIYRSGDRPTQHNAFYRWVWRYIKKRTRHFVADSRFIRSELQGTGIQEDRISVIYAPAPRRKASGLSAHPNFHIEQDGFRFLFVGQVTRHKGVDLLVEAFRLVAPKHPKAHLLIAGRISDWEGDSWARRLKDKVNSNSSIMQRIHFLGLVEEIPELLKSSQVHVAPSALEPYGLVVIEAKQAGIPSIIFPTGGMAELVNDGVDGTAVHSKNIEGLANALEIYLLNPDLARVQGEEARKSLEALEIPQFAERWHNIYKTSQ